jgi:Asp-tRNA(Asn)/Glu-tRNA(Gln) amidotransferase A subunit family amidase
MRPLHELGAAEAVALLRRGAVSSEALVRACLERIAGEEPRVAAWEHFDPELALAQARRADDARSALGESAPLLAGLPVGVKDIIDTVDMPTACGSSIHRGRRPSADAACVAALRTAGAVILGKTVTTEFALFTPGKTRNPRHPGHTPGGSSSGSAAAVAASMVPAAVGSQTAGSVIRPASFCGVFGFKPTHGLVSLVGVSPLAPSLDTLGVFAREAADLPVLARALGVALPAAEPLAAAPRIGLCRTAQWPMASADTRRAVEEAAAKLARAGAAVSGAELGPELEGLYEAQKTIMAVEIARSFADHRRERGDLLSASLREVIDAGTATPPERYRAAQDLADRARRLLPRVFAEVDVLLTASAPGEAPAGLASTGDPAFCRVWTLLHLPCVNVPGASGARGLPVGVQLVGPLGADAALLASTEWIAERLG